MAFLKTRLVACAIVLLFALSSIFVLTLYGAAATLLAAITVICMIFGLWPHVGALIAATTVVGLVGAFIDNPTNPVVNDIRTLTQNAHQDPVGYDLSPEAQVLAFEVIQACATHNIQQLQSVTRDSIMAVHERPETSWFSWAIKPTSVPRQCLSKARDLAEQSPAYAEQLRSIVADGSQL